MVTGAQLIEIGRQHLRMPYQSWGPRFGPDVADCSGWWVMILRLAGIDVPGNAENSEGLELWGRNAGLEIPLDDAYKTPGAGLFRWGTGDEGHAAGAVGDGLHTLETPAWHEFGHASGQADCLGRDWTGAVCFPNVDYSTGPTADQFAAIVKLEAAIKAATSSVIHYQGRNHDGIKVLQLLLNRAMPQVRPVKLDGIYGPRTLHNLLVWEHNAGLFLHLGHKAWPAGGTVGPFVWKWLRASARI